MTDCKTPPCNPHEVKARKLENVFPTPAEVRTDAALTTAELEAWRDAAAETAATWGAKAEGRNAIIPTLGLSVALVSALLITHGTFQQQFWGWLGIIALLIVGVRGLNATAAQMAAAGRLSAWLATYDAEIKKRDIASPQVPAPTRRWMQARRKA